jgi:hypothetical protein
MNTRLSVTPYAKEPFTVNAKVVGYDGQATLHWGDGSAPTHTLQGRTYDHNYPAVGRYMVTCVDGSGVLIARQQISVTGCLALDEVRVSEDDGGIRVSFGEIDPRLGVSYYRIEWQDGDTEHVWGVPGRAVRHDAIPGVHDVKIVDTSSGRTQKFTVDVTDGPAYDPDFTVHRDTADESGMTVYVRLTKVQPGKPVHIWWDDADGPQLVQTPYVGMEIPHAYTFPGHYMQTIAYAGSTSLARSKSEAVTVPHDDNTGGWKYRDRRKNSSSSLEGSLPSFAFAQRLSRRGLGDHSSWSDLFSRRPRLPWGDAPLAIEGATGVEEPTVQDSEDGELALPPAEDSETTGRIDYNPDEGAGPVIGGK